jgi:serine protease Do
MPTGRSFVLTSLATALALGACHVGQLGGDANAADVAHAVADAGSPAPRSTASAGSDRVADVAERTVASVVNIASKRTVHGPTADLSGIPPEFRRLLPDFGPQDQVQRGVGSGVIVASSGLVLTNNHVVEGADELTITLSDGRKFVGRVRGADKPTDLALVEIVGKVPADLPVMRFGDSDRLRLGESVLAIGSPFALQGTVTAGIVSAKGRGNLEIADYEDFIQTDAAINPGNSGGALVNLDGDLVGINTAIGSRSGGYDGIGFAIPSKLASTIMDRLLRDGKVVRGKLGAYLGDVDPANADLLKLDTARGALVQQIVPGSPAEAAGLKAYDVIVRVDGEAVDDARDLRNTIALKGAGAKVRLDALREGRPTTLTATLGALEDDAGKGQDGTQVDAPGLLSGVRLVAPSDASPKSKGASTHGALVAEVDPGSHAAEAGLRPGDLIVEVDRRAVQGPADVGRLLEGAERAMILVERDGIQRILFLG